jgi:hypothetical protein
MIFPNRQPSQNLTYFQLARAAESGAAPDGTTKPRGNASTGPGSAETLDRFLMFFGMFW